MIKFTFYFLSIILFSSFNVSLTQSSKPFFESAQHGNLNEDQLQILDKLEKDKTVNDLRLVRYKNDRSLTNKESLLLNLYNDIQFKAIKTEFKTYSSTSWAWIGGPLNSNDKNNYVRLFSSDNKISGFIRVKEKFIRITPLGNHIYAIYKKSPSNNLSSHPKEYPSGALFTRSKKIISNPEKNNDNSSGPRTSTPIIFDVLVIYTSEAESSVSDPVVSLINQSEQDANDIYKNSLINQFIKLNVVHKQADANYIEDPSMGVNLERFSNTTDSYFPYIHDLRDQYGADIVILITAGGGADCGLATTIKAYSSEAFAVVKASCMDEEKRFTFTHEIGHLFGGTHDTVDEEDIIAYDYGYGYWVYAGGRPYKTVMAVKATGNDSEGNPRGRERFLSNPFASLAVGISAGTFDKNDVARVHEERISEVAAFKTALPPAFDVTISGPSSFNCNTQSWVANVSNGGSPFSFQWYHRWECDENLRIPCDDSWNPVGNNSPILNFYLCTGNSFLRVDVTDINGNTVTDQHYIQGWEEYPKINSDFDESKIQVPNEFFLLQNYPNPFNPNTTIKFGVPRLANKSINGNLQLTIYSINGALVKTLVNQNYSPGTYSINWDGTNQLGSRASAGIYVYQITYSQGNRLGYKEVKKLILLK
ncbi:MAG: hypothetical protein ISR82_05075 [Candidatus Marinimicrobia bacterium]|nr:hypothetical protein [Candidatus Neomarinimicrobiota bacterium]MBL7010572.1 hypothetical protein [Candidatus Neomarinimicrobiota bacterium]